MGILQSGFNQSLTGLTFLLEQTPGWQARKEQQISKVQSNPKEQVERGFGEVSKDQPNPKAQVNGDVGEVFSERESPAAQALARQTAEQMRARNAVPSMLDLIRQQRESGIIKSNRQMKSMLYKANKIDGGDDQ